MQHQLLDQILPILSAVRDDKEKPERIPAFSESEILPEIKEEEITIPQKYEALVKDIAQNIVCGLICHLNMDTLETEAYPQNSEIDLRDEEEEEEESDKEEKPQYLEWDNVLTFEPLESRESFRIMENFAAQIDNPKVQSTLTDILNRRKPFANFNSYIHHSGFRED